MMINDIRGDKIVTISTDASSQVYDISENGYVGYIPRHKKLLLNHLKDGLENGGGIIIRQFTKMTKDVETKDKRKISIPYKNIYGITLHKGQIIPLPVSEVEKACCTCSETGKTIPREEGVFFKRLTSDYIQMYE